MKKIFPIALALSAAFLALSGCGPVDTFPLAATGGGGGNISYPEAADFPLVVAQTGNVWAIDSITVEGLAHTYAGDLLFTLVAPSGEVFLIRDRSGGSNNFDGDYTFQPGGAANFVISSGVVVPGTYGTDPDTDFDYAPYGERLNGTWYLRITDDASGDAGSILGWSMDLTYY
jgi:serine protease